MAAIKGLEWTFDTVASTYEKIRPGYVEELYQTVFDYMPIIRNEFFAKIEKAIHNHGGTINIYDTIDLQFARKP